MSRSRTRSRASPGDDRVSNKLRIVVLGIMGRTPLAGVTWQVLHYVEGFRRLGHDVYYVEDTGDWGYDPEHDTTTEDGSYAVDYISRIMRWCGLPDRWAYRPAAPGSGTFGLSDTRLSQVFERADALVNLCGATVLRDEHLRVPVRIYLETDPVRPQIEVAQGRQYTIDLLTAHTHHFTFGENLGAGDCRVPVERFDYRPTRQPIVLDWWAPATRTAANGAGGRPLLPDDRFTTISSWKQSGKDVEWNGETYIWSKHVELMKLIDLPRRTRQPLELALCKGDAEAIEQLTSYGWRIVDALAMSKDISPYREYILGSAGEFTVVKDQYIRPRSGWFSDRSACYLAAGKPVITQDTGFGNILPTGRGLFPFRTTDQILDALEEIKADYGAHARAAQEIAREYFGADCVLGSLLERTGL